MRFPFGPGFVRKLTASTLLLLVLRVRADNHDTSVAADYLALLAHGLYRWSNFHMTKPPYFKTMQN